MTAIVSPFFYFVTLNLQERESTSASLIVRGGFFLVSAIVGAMAEFSNRFFFLRQKKQGIHSSSNSKCIPSLFPRVRYDETCHVRGPEHVLVKSVDDHPRSVIGEQSFLIKEISRSLYLMYLPKNIERRYS